MRWRIFWAVVLAATLGTQSAALLKSGEPITAANAARVTEVGRVGRGVIREVAWSPDASRLAVATTLGVWVEERLTTEDAETTESFEIERKDGEGEDVLLEGQTGASSVAFSPDGRLLVSGGDDGSMMVWETEDLTAETQRRLTTEDTENTEVLIVGEEGFSLRQRLEGHLYAVTALAFSPAGDWLAAADVSGVVRVWDMRGAAAVERAVWQGVGDPDALLFSPDGRWLTAFSADQAMLWSVAAGGSQACVCPPAEALPDGGFDNPPVVLEGYTAPLVGVAWEDDLLVTVDERGRQMTWLPNGRVLQREQSRSLPEQGGALSPDGRRRVEGGADSVLRVFDAATGEERAALRGHLRAVTSAAFSPAGNVIASGSLDGTIRLWEAESGAALAVLTGHTAGVTSVVFNADGTLLASASYDGTARVWGIPA